MSNHLNIDDEAELIEAMYTTERAEYGAQLARKEMAEHAIVTARKVMMRIRRRVRARMRRAK